VPESPGISPRDDNSGEADWTAALREHVAPAVEALRRDAERLVCNAKAASADYGADADKVRAACDRLAALITDIQTAPAAVNRGKLRHDLRTPVNAIKGYGEILMEDAGDASHVALEAEFREFLRDADAVLARIDALAIPAA
jgi:adenylate cyclase